MVEKEDNGEIHTQKQNKASEYEQSREERIKENLERMRKLGIYDLSLKFKSIKPNKTRKTPQKFPASPLPPSQPTRRSSRLQNVVPVSYSEIPLGKKSLDVEDDLVKEVGAKPEIYTEEHEKLLGSTDMSWTLFVDGYGKDGKRIYDPVRGKTCHQCRQKTLGLRTHCCRCNMVQGQFCGDCLFMRYGEHVVEANQNPDWICPACRGICNCSLCRQAKGWAPTGSLYRKVTQLGYKSVAHYLIQTRQAKTDPENIVLAKRPLPFSKESSEACNETQDEEKVIDYEPIDDNKVAEDAGKEPLEEKPCSENDEANPKVDKESHIIVKVENGCENAVLGSEIRQCCDGILGLETSPKSKKNQSCPGEPILDSIAGRLRGRSNKTEKAPSDGTPKAEQTPQGNASDAKPFDSILAPETSLSSKRKRRAAEPIPDSIAGRLRQRRVRNN